MRLPVALIVLVLVSVAAVGVGQVGASGDVSLDVSNSLSVPSEEVEFEGSTFTVSSISSVEPGEEISASISAPDDEVYNVQLRDKNANLVDFETAEGSSSVSFATSGLEPGSYVVAVEVAGSIEALHPVVVAGYDLDVSAPSSATQHDELTVTADLSYGELTSDPHGVEVGLHNDGEQLRATAENVDGNTYEATISLGEIAPGKYTLSGVAVDSDTIDGEVPVILAVDSGDTVDVEESDENSEDDEEDTESGDDEEDAGNGEDSDESDENGDEGDGASETEDDEEDTGNGEDNNDSDGNGDDSEDEAGNEDEDEDDSGNEEGSGESDENGDESDGESETEGDEEDAGNGEDSGESNGNGTESEGDTGTEDGEEDDAGTGDGEEGDESDENGDESDGASDTEGDEEDAGSGEDSDESNENGDESDGDTGSEDESDDIETSDSDDGGAGFGVLAVMAALGCGVLYLTRRRS